MESGTIMASKKNGGIPGDVVDGDSLVKLVLASQALTQREKDVWCALYQYGAQTAGEIDKRIGSTQSASSRLSELERRNMVRRIGRRRCSVTGRSAAVWKATSATPVKIAKSQKKYHSPTNTELKSFVNLVRIAFIDANGRGVRISANAKRVLKWLEDGAPCAHDRLKK